MILDTFSSMRYTNEDFHIILSHARGAYYG